MGHISVYIMQIWGISAFILCKYGPHQHLYSKIQIHIQKWKCMCVLSLSLTKSTCSCIQREALESHQNMTQHFFNHSVSGWSRLYHATNMLSVGPTEDMVCLLYSYNTDVLLPWLAEQSFSVCSTIYTKLKIVLGFR